MSKIERSVAFVRAANRTHAVPPAGGTGGGYGEPTSTDGDVSARTTPDTTAAAVQPPSANWDSGRTAAASPLTQLPTVEEDTMSVPTPGADSTPDRPNNSDGSSSTPYIRPNDDPTMRLLVDLENAAFHPTLSRGALRAYITLRASAVEYQLDGWSRHYGVPPSTDEWESWLRELVREKLIVCADDAITFLDTTPQVTW